MATTPLVDPLHCDPRFLVRAVEAVDRFRSLQAVTPDPVPMAVADMRKNLSEVLNLAHYANNIITIEKRGKPFACMIGSPFWQAYQQLCAVLKEFNESAHCVEGAVTNENRVEVMSALVAHLQRVERVLTEYQQGGPETPELVL